MIKLAGQAPMLVTAEANRYCGVTAASSGCSV